MGILVTETKNTDFKFHKALLLGTSLRLRRFAMTIIEEGFLQSFPIHSKILAFFTVPQKAH